MVKKSLNAFPQFVWLKTWMKTSGFSLLMGAWKNDKEIIYSVLLASLIINILTLVFPLTLLQVYDRIIPHQSRGTLIWLTILVFTALIISAFLKIVRSYVGAWADAKFEHHNGCRAFNSLLGSKLSLYEKEGSGRHLKRMTALSSLKQFYAGQALIALVDVPFIFLYLALIAYIANWLVLAPIAIIIMAFVTTLNNTAQFQKKLIERQDHDERRLNFIVETLSKIHTIKSNTMEAQMLRRFERLQKSSSSYDYQITQGSAALISDSIVFSQVTVVLVAGLGSALVFNGILSLGILAACILLAGQCLQPVNSLLSMWGRLQTVKIAHQELNRIMAMVPESNSTLQPLREIEGKIEFIDLNFQYPDKEFFILNNINLTIEPRETISITGEGLSGKSTLLSLLLKLNTPTSGHILIDGKNIDLLSPESLRQGIGYMPEQAVLFKGTILQNLTMFRDEYDVRARLLSRETGLSSYVEQFPDGYETKVGYQATATLPRGLIQHIVIIRALVSDPKIILFDEANITIDMEGDRRIIELLKNLRGKHTMILVSHRPSVLAIAHRNYLLEDGKLRLMAEENRALLPHEK
jgi:ATP-binding cassette subfamily C protein LapB